MSVKVLEETLGVQSVLSHELHELSSDSLNIGSLLWGGLKTVILNLGSCNSHLDVKVLLESLLSENFISIIAELSPLDMVASLWCLVCLSQCLELLVRDWDLGHAQSHSELVRCDEARSELVKVAEELADTDSLLESHLADSGKNVVHISWIVAHNLSLGNSSLSLGEVVKAVVEVLAHLEELLGAVNILAEINIVDLVNVSHVHVSLQETLEDVHWGVDSEAVENSEELGLGNMAILGDVEVLEDWLQMDSHGLDSLLVLIQDCLDFATSCWVGAQVLSSGEKGIVLGDWGNHGGWCLINSLDSECLVDVGHEVNIAEEALWVHGGVLVGQSFKLIVGQVKVQLGKDGLELRSGDSSLSELVEVAEELLNTNSVLNNLGTKSVLNIAWIVEDLDSWLTESIIDDIEVVGLSLEEGAHLSGSYSEHVNGWCLWLLSLVSWEHILWSVDILAEFEIVNFLVVAAVAVLSNDEVEDFVTLWHQVELLEHAEELLLSNVLTLRSVEVHEVWLQKDSV